MRMLPPFPQWYVTPLRPSPSRAERRRHEAEQVWARNRIRWIWDRACAGTDLARWVVVADRLNLRTPRVGPITLDENARLSVELHPGQRAHDIARIADVLAAAFEVPAVDVVDLVPGWVTVELLVAPPLYTADTIAPQPAVAPERVEPGTAPRVRPGRRHLARRATRRSYGGPAGLRRRRANPPEPRQPGGSAAPA